MKTRVLVVEDEAGWRQTLSRTLEDNGYQVTQAADGRDAIELLNQSGIHRPGYDIVLTDIVMEDIDGIEVMHTAREQFGAPEVILLTGHGSLETAIAAVRAGAFDYLLKPCPTARLLECIRAAVMQHEERLCQLREQKMLRTIARLFSDFPLSSISPLSPPPNQPVPLPEPPDIDHTTDRYLHVGRLKIDTHRYEVWFDDQELHVTPIEYRILACLATTPDRVVGYKELARFTHGYSIETSEARELLSRHVRNLRYKFNPRYLVNLRGVGYMLVDPERIPEREAG